MMKFIWTILFFTLFHNSAYAISSINSDVIKEAQQYGKVHMHSNLEDFLGPWVSYEERAERLNETAEHAYLYTNFLLIATDAREKSLHGQNVDLADSERILNNYAGTLSFSVVLYGSEVHFGRKTKVIIKQNEKVIKAYQVAIPLEAEKAVSDSNQPLFRLQCYFYFWEKNIAWDKPMTLSIITGDRKQHRFYFNTAKIK